MFEVYIPIDTNPRFKMETRSPTSEYALSKCHFTLSNDTFCFYIASEPRGNVEGLA